MKYISEENRWYYVTPEPTEFSDATTPHKVQIIEDNTVTVPAYANIQDLFGSGIIPHVTISSVSPVVSNTLTVSGSVYSSKAEITTIKAIVFASEIDLDALDETVVKNFINANGTSITTLTNTDLSSNNLRQYEVGQFEDFALTTVYTSTDLSATTNGALVDGNTYKVAVLGIDSDTNKGVGFN